MERISNSGLVGAGLIGLGLGITAVGVTLILPAFTDWSMNTLERAVQKGRDNLAASTETMANFAGQIASRAQQTFSDATKTAKQTTAKAAGAVEGAAHRVREYTS
ncbi:MAG TPA: hypothetical protein VF283_04795 [Bryobacteraceae bacterium]